MSKRQKVVPDHYQTDPGSKVAAELYAAQQEKLQEEEAPPVAPGKGGLGKLLHAGQPLGQPVAAVCVECGEKIGFPGDVPVTPCRVCGSDTFRVESR